MLLSLRTSKYGSDMSEGSISACFQALEHTNNPVFHKQLGLEPLPFEHWSLLLLSHARYVLYISPRKDVDLHNSYVTYTGSVCYMLYKRKQHHVDCEIAQNNKEKTCIYIYIYDPALYLVQPSTLWVGAEGIAIYYVCPSTLCSTPSGVWISVFVGLPFVPKSGSAPGAAGDWCNCWGNCGAAQ